MTRTERLEPVVKHGDKKEKLALEAMALSQGELELEKNKFSQLKSYKKEYLQDHVHKNQVFSAFELQQYNRFLAQLDLSIAQQSDLVDLRTKELDSKRESWHAMRIESKVMHKVVDNLQRQATVLEARLEQKQMDELVQRKNQKSSPLSR